MKILCIGEALIDMICTDKNVSLSNGNNFVKKPGGAPTNVAAAIAALGSEVLLAAKVGNDPFGKQLIETMESFGVDTSAMLTTNDYFTSFAFVSLVEAGERDFVFNRGADAQLTIDDIDSINLNEVSIIHFGSATGFLPGPLQAAYLHLLEKAIHHRIFISFDPNYRHLLFKNNTLTFIAQSWHYLQNCNFFKLSDEEALLITETDTLKKAVEILFAKTTGVFAITLGKEGTLLALNGEQYMIESIAVQSIDTTGAGDAFVGAVLYQLNQFPIGKLKDLPFNEWKKIILNANKAGARTCEYLGAMEAFKHLNNHIFNS